MNKKQIFTHFFYSILLITIFYINGIVGVLEVIFSLIVYFLLFYFLHILIRRIRKKEYMTFEGFLNYFLFRVSIFLIFVFSTIGGFAYYNNELFPAPMPEITISNGSKTVVFQAMSHIGTDNFYNTVKKNLTKKKKEGYVYFFEGVRLGKKENNEKFDKALGVKFDKDLYKNFSKLYGVVNQDNNIFLGLENDLDFNIDLSMDEIIELYEQRPEDDEDKKIKNELPLDINKQIIETLVGLNEKQLVILRYINKSILNFLIKSDGVQEVLTDNFTNKALFDVILNKRNDVLSNEIINSKYDKIYVTYGLLHFDGVLKILQENDSNWKETGRKNYYPIK